MPERVLVIISVLQGMAVVLAMVVAFTRLDLGDFLLTLAFTVLVVTVYVEVMWNRGTDDS